jgi:hypothetical protein
VIFSNLAGPARFFQAKKKILSKDFCDGGISGDFALCGFSCIVLFYGDSGLLRRFTYAAAFAAIWVFSPVLWTDFSFSYLVS